MSHENWWLDYVEGEVDSSTRTEMKSILRHSPKAQDLVKSISDTKSLIKEHADREPEISEDFLDQMHDRIMASIEKTEIKPAPRFKLRSYHRRWAKTASAGLALAAAFVSGASYLAHQEINPQWDISQQIVRHAQENPEELAQLMALQNEHDFFVDVATLSLDHLSKEQFESLMKFAKTKTR